MIGFKASEGGRIVRDLIKKIQENKEYLSEIDGLIGDGDHGINMNKGFTKCEEKIKDDNDIHISKAFRVLGRTLLMEIGGSMGPLYGTFFIEMSKTCDNIDFIDADVFSRMLKAAVAGISNISNARPGDKSLMDTLVPAQEAFDAALLRGEDFKQALIELKEAAEKGMESTKDIVAKIGRASRLGERSRGVLDAGAASCNLILQSICDSVISLLD